MIIYDGGPEKDVENPMNPLDPGYYDEYELRDIGFKATGSGVRIARNCTIAGIENIEIGNNVRIDGYTSIIAAGAGWLKLGSYIHIGGHCHFSAGDGIRLEDFTGISQGVRIYSRSDDYLGNHMTGPLVPEKYTGITGGPVTMGRHVLIGSGSVILPNVSIGEGSSVGAMSLVNRSLEPWGVYYGIPAKRMKERSKRLLELEAELLHDLNPRLVPDNIISEPADL